MRFRPVQPARLEFDEDGTPMAPDFGDVYHARAGALQQAQAVFLKGNGLPERWRGRHRFVVLETGFGLGQNFLATWQAWSEDPQACRQLWFVSVEKHPVPQELAQRALGIHQGTALEAKAQALLAAWPPASPDLFRATFDEGRVVLQVVHADVALALRELSLQADALYLDGFTPWRNRDMWSPIVFKALARLVAPGCTAASWSAARPTCEGLVQAGFELERRPGFAGKDWSVAARLARSPIQRTPPDGALPSLTPPALTPSSLTPSSPAPPTLAPPTLAPTTRTTPPGTAAAVPSSTGPGNGPWCEGDAPVVIVGAGLAGAACAQALSASGIPSLVLERHPHPAAGASGNPAGLFHGVLHTEDGAHARLGRAAAWMAHQHYAPLIRAGLIQGQAEGLLRLEKELSPAQMQAQIDALGLPAAYVQAWGSSQLAEALGLTTAGAPSAWHYPGGGWIAPADWVRHALSRPGVTLRTGVKVQGLQRDAQGWLLSNEDGQVLARTRHVVLCAAGDVVSLLPPVVTQSWPTGLQRGQITRVPHTALPAPGPLRPLSGGGYALTLPNGDLLCGATAHREDDDPRIRENDHAANLQRLRGLLNWRLNASSTGLEGRVGWRFQTADRLPIAGPIGAWSEAEAMPSSLRMRDLRAEPGLYAATALGSRGITWAPMIGAVLAACISGEPAPLPRSLLEALDPRRFALKRARRHGG